MRLRKLIVLLLLLCCSFQIFATATEEVPLKNLEIVKLQILENGDGYLSVYYGYPIIEDVKKIETEKLIDDAFTVSIGELVYQGQRYATISCSIQYSNMTELSEKIQFVSTIENSQTLFNFYVLLDSIATNLNLQQTEEGTTTATIDTSCFVNQKYYMTNLDEGLVDKLSDVDTTTVRNVHPLFFLIVPNNISLSNSKQFSFRELENGYTEYCCDLNNQILTVTMNKVVEKAPSKLEQFLNSDLYYVFLATSGLFVIALVIVILNIAKSLTKVIEMEEQQVFEEEKGRSSINDPKLYWSRSEREDEKKKKTLLSKNTLVRDADLKAGTESIETSQYRRKNNFRNDV